MADSQKQCINCLRYHVDQTEYAVLPNGKRIDSKHVYGWLPLVVFFMMPVSCALCIAPGHLNDPGGPEFLFWDSMVFLALLALVILNISRVQRAKSKATAMIEYACADCGRVWHETSPNATLSGANKSFGSAVLEGVGAFLHVLGSIIVAALRVIGGIIGAG